ncbi:uncharacterized protein LOC113295258 [Papaver somniferum]|uniref:uncharacterized protein LOC113295258 n=1 Tax=Papaver somniferum TaxID=3469 RepID=UPI000E6F732E|nr:uncharacterized protein LOC113295258 [Papaver somniferum]
MYLKLTERTMNHYNLGQPDSFWKSLWDLNVSQRIKIFIWEGLQDALSTNLKLSAFMEDLHSNCSFGCNTIESTEHFLFSCPFAKSVWAENPFPMTLNIHASTSFLEICKEWLGNKNTNISIEIILTKAWFIWKERCNKVFEQKQQSSTQLGIKIQRYLDYWYKDNLPRCLSTTHNTKKQVWLSPEKARLKININAAWKSMNFPAGFSLIARNDAGDFKTRKAGPLKATTPEEAEALGFCKVRNEQQRKDYQIFLWKATVKTFLIT